VTGSDGALWFTEYFGDRIGRVTTSGAITEYPLPRPSSEPETIVSASDGALWFTEQTGNAIGRITTSGAITEFPLAANSLPEDMTLGPDGTPWFTASDHIGHISALGAVTEYAVPTANSAPIGITLGSDGALWFSEMGAAKIGRVTIGGAFSEYPLPSGVKYPWQIASGPDGAVWFLAQGYIGRITMSGVISTWAVTSIDTGSLNAITLGADGHMWYTQRSGNSLDWFAVP
jgi:virginiamycin B lyase